MRHRPIAIGLIAALTVVCSSALGVNISEASADEVYQAIRTDQVASTDMNDARKAMSRAVEKDPTNPTWRAGLALALAELEEWKDARKEIEEAVELAPETAEYHVMQADIIFAGIQEASLLSQGSLASQGRKAYLRAVELDPDNIEARAGLAGYYIFAPGIAGGSLTKGKEHAEALIEIEGAERTGHIFLAQIAIKRDDWAQVDASVANALDASETPEGRLDVIRSIAIALAFQAKAYDRAEILVAAHEDEIASDSTSLYVWGLSLHEQERYEEAIVILERVLAVKSDVVNTKFRLAQCYEEMGRWADAQSMYQEYIDLNPKASDVKAAKKGVKRMKKKQR